MSDDLRRLAEKIDAALSWFDPPLRPCSTYEPPNAGRMCRNCGECEIEHLAVEAAATLRALAAAQGTPAEVRVESHEHHFRDYWTCSVCGQTEAAILGCHHCDEVAVGTRCRHCLRLRATPDMPGGHPHD